MTFLVSTQTVERSLSNMSILFGQVCTVCENVDEGGGGGGGGDGGGGCT